MVGRFSRQRRIVCRDLGDQTGRPAVDAIQREEWMLRRKTFGLLFIAEKWLEDAE